MKLGIFGLGRAGQRHARNALALGHEVFGYDIDRSKVALPRIKWAADRKGFFDEIEAVVVATPSECHLDDLTACFEAGKHVLVEKPLALTRQRQDVQTLIETNAQSKSPRTIAVGYNLRFHPLVIEAREVIAEETFVGRPPYYASFTCCQWTDSPDAVTNGCLDTWACHEIDLAEHLCGPLRLLDHHGDHTSVNLGLARWEGPPCFVVVHSDMRAQQRLRQIMVCTDSKTHVVDLERNPVTDKHYRAELKAFIDRVNGEDDDTLASGEEGVLALQLVERAMP